MRILLAIVLFASVAFCAANPFSIHDKIHQVRQSGEPLNHMIRAHLERSSEFTPLQTINEAVRFAAQSNFHTQDLSACRAAVSALNNATLECNLAEILQGYINPMNLLNSSLTTFCQSNCTGKLESVLGRVNRTCKNFVSIDTGVAGFQDALVAAKTGCTTDTEGLYCLRAYRRVANATQAFSTNTLTADQLESACRSPCIQQQFSAITEYGRGQIVATMGFYKTMCSQINGEFCALTYQSFQQASSNNPNATVQQEQVCQPCFRRFLTGTFEMLSVAAVNTTTTAGSLTSAVNSLSYLCAKDQNGAYCSQRINDQPPQIQSCAQILISNVTGVPTTCPANCTQDMTLAINNLGCCMNTVFKLLVAQNSIPSDFTVDKINGLLQNSCNISLPGGCVSGQVNMTLAMRNVKSAFVVSDWATIKTALQNDLSGRLGVARDAIQVLGYSLNFTDAPVQPPVTPNNTNQTQQAMHPRARFYLRVDANNSTNGTQGNNTNPQPPVVTPNTTVDTGLPGFRAFLSIVPPAQDELDLVFNELTTALPARDLDLAHLGSSIPLLSRVDPMQGLEVEPAYSSVTGPSTDTLATSPAPRAATVAVAALVLSGMVHLLASSL